ncbi:MAG: hypothetical protein J3R72DRAFT_486826 [Linnemannia gamsii]|nr:MAG: hypothetical protein J3R72DRAFT_486826 [Linnemannia gamsii]
MRSVEDSEDVFGSTYEKYSCSVGYKYQQQHSRNSNLDAGNWRDAFETIFMSILKPEDVITKETLKLSDYCALGRSPSSPDISLREIWIWSSTSFQKSRNLPSLRLKELELTIQSPEAIATFFSIPELVELLAVFLNSQELARLSATSSAIDNVCSPILWRYFSYKNSVDNKQKQVRIEQLKGLVRRGHHTRSFHADALILVLYVNGINETLDDSSSTTSTTTTRPAWLPAPNPHMFVNSFKDPSQGIQDIEKFDASNKLRQLCWLLELNPCLTYVTLSALEPKTTDNSHILARAIASLSRLKHLRVEFFASAGPGPWIEGIKTLFFSCPVSLQSLELRTYHSSGPLVSLAGLSSSSSPSPAISSDTILNPMVDAPIMRDGPLHLLKELQLPILTAMPLADYSRILKHCPNIDTFSVVPLVNECVPIVAELTPSVKEHCKHIRHVRINRTTSWWYDWDPYLILDGLHSPLESLQIEFYDEGREVVNKDHAISSFHRHSSTLKDIRLLSCEILSDEVIRSILGTCAVLERLELSDRSDRQAVASLSELVAYKWVCTDLKYLRMTIDWGGFSDPTPSHLPAYYVRRSNSPPLPLSEQDKEVWEQLEGLYRQIGSLVRLEVLDLSVYFGRMNRNPYQPIDPTNEWSQHFPTFDTSFRSPDRFPLLLSLGTHASGRQGYLSWLSGIKNLKELRGSVHLGNPENAMTLKQPELEWMVENWPKLRVLELLPYQDEPPVHVNHGDYCHVNWVMKRKPGLDLRRRWRSPGSPWDGLWSQSELSRLIDACN